MSGRVIDLLEWKIHLELTLKVKNKRDCIIFPYKCNFYENKEYLPIT